MALYLHLQLLQNTYHLPKTYTFLLPLRLDYILVRVLFFYYSYICFIRIKKLLDIKRTKRQFRVTTLIYNYLHNYTLKFLTMINTDFIYYYFNKVTSGRPVKVNIRISHLSFSLFNVQYFTIPLPRIFLYKFLFKYTIL